MPDGVVGPPLCVAELCQKEARSKILWRDLNGVVKFLFGLGEVTALEVRTPENDARAGISGMSLDLPYAQRDGLVQSPRSSILVRSPHRAVQ
jgi:hypothetical protein